MRGWWLVVIAACGRVSFDARPDAAPDAAPDAITACTVAACPADFTLLGTGCYKLVPTLTRWLDAELACEALGAHLVAEDSVEEHFDIHTLAANVSEVWVGWTDRRGPDNVFSWVVPVAGDLLQSNTCVFGPGEPDAGDADHCVAQAGTNVCGDYNDISCESLRAYVCECDGQLADPASY